MSDPGTTIKPKISIITVAFDNAPRLETTILSVLGQTYNNIEYIIIDGGSTDNSVDIIKLYEDRLSFWISEIDEGIYDAMNKGISKATGSFVNFMKAGDAFHSKESLSNLFDSPDIRDVLNADVIYGNHAVKSASGFKIFRPKALSNIERGSFFCHQSAFTANKLHKSKPYNIQNTIAADFEFFYFAYLNNHVFKYVDQTICSITPEGISDINRIETIVSWWNVVNKTRSTNFYFIRRIIRETVVGYVKKIINSTKCF
jgi:glycosyltransferase involved in cell wall biosynthesis